ncbi:toxin VasX [Pseudomonas zhanjiangensis]|uniref:Toxin VasX n=1 Tax=Pseudomonas zhanjiangensis TaxID=3239015 RepID=A0ABV3YU71_9PSED
MSATPQDKSLRLAQADQAAQQNFEKDDLGSPVASCPARQAEVFIVPVRYALAESAAQHSRCKPAVKTHSHPMALRRLRPGYLYLWHDQGPLRRFTVAGDGQLVEQGLDDADAQVPKGALAGIALNKQHDAWLLYSEIPLPKAAYQRLASEAGERKARMRRISLSQVARTLEAEHCPPLDSADLVMAELMPDVRDQALAHDYAQNGDGYREGTRALGEQMRKDPRPEVINAYISACKWLREREDAHGRHPNAGEHPPGEWSAQPWDVAATDTWLNQARSQAGLLHGVFASLDDDLGVLRDLNFEQEQLEARHTDWVADNNLRQSVGGFIRSLISEDGGEVANMLNYRYREHDIQLTPAQGETMLESQRQLNELFKEETRINHERGRQYSHRQADALLVQVHAQVAAATAPVRSFIPAHLQTEAEYVVREYSKAKLSNLEGGRASAKVAEYVDLPRMDAWLDEEAPAHYRQVEQRNDVFYADRDRYLPRHALGTWFVEHENPAHQEWLDGLAAACLSAQCTRERGAMQFASYVRAADDGIFRLIFQAWSPSIEAALNNTNRFNELVTALSHENLADTRTALAASLDEPVLRAIERLAHEVEGAWATTVARLGGALVLLKAKAGLATHWAGLMLVARFGQDSRLIRGIEEGVEVWRLAGAKADALKQWTQNTAQAIRSGRAAGIVQSPAVKNSGGVLPLLALLLNAMNAEIYVSQASVLEGEDEQRRADRVSATLFTAAALAAVVQNWMIKGKGIQEITGRLGSNISATAPTLTLFGGAVGIISAAAAFKELASLQLQIENAQSRIDPWLEIRRLAVTGQVAVYGAQGLLGLSLTAMRLANKIDTPAAIRQFKLRNGPLNLLLLALGGAYIYAWLRQATPLQNYLASCCWSRGRAYKNEGIAPATQLAEFEQLLVLLYQPHLSMQIQSVQIAGTAGDTVTQDGISALSIDLPGAEPGSAQLELAMIGNPTPANVRMFGEGTRGTPTDLGAVWLARSQCSWIPVNEGQGLRLSGPFARPLTRLSLRLRYHSPVAVLAGAGNVVGGERGLAYTLSPGGFLTDGEVIPLRPTDPTPELNRAVPQLLKGPEHFQPKDSA